MLRQFLRLERRNCAFVKGVLLFIVFAVGVSYARADVNIPDTPAGHTLSAFFDAFNTADHDRIAAYVKEYDPENNADGLTSSATRQAASRSFLLCIARPTGLPFLFTVVETTSMPTEFFSLTAPSRHV